MHRSAVGICLGPHTAGWLPLMRGLSCTLSIRSPVDCSPSVIAIELVKPIFDNTGAINKYELWMPQYDGELQMVGHEPSIYALDELRDLLYVKAFVFPDPSTGSYIVVLIHKPEYHLSFARAGDCKWTLLPPGCNYQDCIYVDGLLYALKQIGGIDAFDLTGSTITRKKIVDDMKDYIYELVYIVQAPWGDVLQVWKETVLIDVDEEETRTQPTKFLLFKVDMAAKELVEINSMHDRVLFLGLNQSQCLSAQEYPQLKANCVYFTEDREHIAYFNNNHRGIGVFNLENDNREEIVSQLWCCWPNPIWITPNLTMMKLGLYK